MKAGERLAQRFLQLDAAAEGGMGTIFRASDELSGEEVALKVMSGVAGGSGQERFAREAAILARLSHPAIVRLIAYGHTPGGEPFLVMPFLQGEALDERLARSALSLEESMLALRRAAEALAVAHAGGVVHRDIKPSNLFLVDGDPRRRVVLDFGVARLARATMLTATGALVGTVGYMAPEQASGDVDVSPAADVFALGCVLYECLSGRQAFGAPSALAALTALLLQEPEPIRERDLDPRLAALLSRMLHKDPLCRPSDGRALLAELDALAEAPAATAPTQPPPADAMTAKERRLVSLVLAEEQAGGEGATVALAEASATLERLRAEIAPHGAQLAPLGVECYLATLARGGSATDQAARAAACALTLRATLGAARIAVATGQAESVGSAMAGPVVERASALMLRVAPDEIQVDSLTATLLEGRFLLEPANEGAARLIAERRDPLGQRTPLGRQLPLCGRDKELALLEATVAEALDEGLLRAAVIIGEAGMGKSRLCLELRRRVGDEVRWLAARADSSAAGAPLDMARKLLRAASGDDEIDAEDVCAHLARLAVAPERWPYLLHLAVVAHDPPADVRAVLADPGAGRVQIAEAFKDWLAALAAQAPLVVHCEDIHWVDDAALALLEGAARRVEGRALVLLATTRPQATSEGVWRALEAQAIRLHALTPRAARRMAEEAGAADADELDAIVERSRGNPFFVEELLRWRALGRGDRPPETLLAILQARVDALDDDARRVLRAGAILDGTFTAADLAALVGARRPRRGWPRGSRCWSSAISWSATPMATASPTPSSATPATPRSPTTISAPATASRRSGWRGGRRSIRCRWRNTSPARASSPRRCRGCAPPPGTPCAPAISTARSGSPIAAPRPAPPARPSVSCSSPRFTRSGGSVASMR